MSDLNHPVKRGNNRSVFDYGDIAERGAPLPRKRKRKAMPYEGDEALFDDSLYDAVDWN
jgi:hypothetical protein